MFQSSFELMCASDYLIQEQQERTSNAESIAKIIRIFLKEGLSGNIIIVETKIATFSTFVLIKISTSIREFSRFRERRDTLPVTFFPAE